MIVFRVNRARSGETATSCRAPATPTAVQPGEDRLDGADARDDRADVASDARRRPVRRPHVARQAGRGLRGRLGGDQASRPRAGTRTCRRSAVAAQSARGLASRRRRARRPHRAVSTSTIAAPSCSRWRAAIAAAGSSVSSAHDDPVEERAAHRAASRWPSSDLSSLPLGERGRVSSGCTSSGHFSLASPACAAMLAQLVDCRGCARRPRPARHDPFAEPIVGRTDDCHVVNGRMRREDVLDLDRRDVHPAADDPVVEPSAQANVAVGVDRRLVSGHEPAVSRKPCGFGITPYPLASCGPVPEALAVDEPYLHAFERHGRRWSASFAPAHRAGTSSRRRTRRCRSTR